MESADIESAIARFRALGDVVRLRIVEALEVRGELSTSQLAKITGTRGLKFHLEMLRDAAVIEQVGPEDRSRTRWRLAAEPLIDWDESLAANKDAADAIRALEQATTYRLVDRLRSFDSEVRSGEWPTEWADAASRWDFMVSGLTVAQLESLEEELVATVRRYKALADKTTAPPGAARPVFVALVALPLRFRDEKK